VGPIYKYSSGYHTGQSCDGEKEVTVADEVLAAAVGCLDNRSQQSGSLVDDELANHGIIPVSYFTSYIWCHLLAASADCGFTNVFVR